MSSPRDNLEEAEAEEFVETYVIPQLKRNGMRGDICLNPIVATHLQSDLLEWNSPEGNAMKYFYLGESCRNSEKFNDAIMHFKKAKEINSKIGNKSIEASTSESLGICYAELGHYKEALAFAKDGLDISDELGKKTGKANGYVSLGIIYSRLGRFSDAIENQKKGLEIVIRQNRNDFLTEIAWGNLGDSYNLNKEHEKAIKCCKRSLIVHAKCKIGCTVQEGRSLHNMGNAFCQLGKFEEAIEHCEKSIAIFTSKDGKSRKGESVSYGVLANAHRSLGHSEKALYYYEKCIEMNKEMQRYTDVAIASGNLGGFYTAIALNSSKAKKCHKNLENSIEYLKNAIGITNEQFMALSVDENKTSFADRFYHWHVSLVVPFNLTGRIEAALLVLDLGKAKALRNMMIDEQKKPSKVLQQDCSVGKYRDESWLSIESGKEKERLVDLSREIQLKQSDSTVLSYAFDKLGLLIIWVLNMDGSVSCPLDAVSPSSETALEEHISSILLRVETRMPRGYSFFSQAPSTNERRPCEQQKPKNENLDVEKATNDTRKQTKISACTKTVSTSNSSSQVIYQATASNSTDGLLDNSQPGVTKANEISTSKPVPAQTCSDTPTDEDPSRLYQALISPVKAFIKGKKLIIVPHGCLFFAPFSSLIDEHGCYLSEKYQIQITPSVHTLATRMKAPHSNNIGTSLFVGSPKVGKVSYKDKKRVIGLLPSAIKEVQSLASLLGAKAIVEAEATKERVIRLMRNATIIHIAAHGEEGTILLAPNSSKKAVLPTEESYLLTQRDVLGCELSARLVVLSCCHTGRGEKSSEGILGIARSFLGAGARSVLVTLWEIHDDATREFMEHFYAKVCEGTSVCEALKKTMNMFQQHEQYKSFFYWAPFEIMGEDVKFSKKEFEEMRVRNSEPLK